VPPAPTSFRLKLVVLALTPAVVLAAMLVAAFSWWRGGAKGKALNQLAWERSFTERDQAVPPSGPRDGYWGARLGSKVPDPKLYWREPPVHQPALLDIDDSGMQHRRTGMSPKRRVLIIGGSVAMGAYASSIATTYFNVLGAELERLGTPADITIVASGAWKALQEGVAVEQYGDSLAPDVVVLLNGLNDLTVGSTARRLFGQETPTRDGSAWTTEYHEHDYDARVQVYLEIMRRVGSFVRRHGRVALVVLQPSLAERATRTSIEDRLLAASTVPLGPSDALRRSYQEMRDGLAELARQGWLHFLDCSRLFDGERATTFADLWHFSDFGHRLLGDAMAAEIAPVLRALAGRESVAAHGQ
jgi:lysophospholipase L1-like esterase